MLTSKVKGQGYRGQKMRCALPSPPIVTEWNALAENNVMQEQTGPFRRCRSVVISAIFVRFMFGKNIFSSSLFLSLFYFNNKRRRHKGHLQRSKVYKL